ncbi:type VI secretion system baseplate subunit TssG [Burkholderia ubonensis]|uniref:type VI secretion system baseplate subunit TssG n=1 Tax=Burkholderia ubonensis TaxID=101571 RepID=UPI00075B3AB6|nr:type VI secretion system baseplate subunit TssG [Burkholderia ubonensis]KVT59157.1 type VI secretion protein [Burkholderia ubonensis]
MNFYRFCALIELAALDAAPLGATDSPATDPVRFRSRAQLGFPAREIDAVEFDLDDPATPPVVRTTFLGLYGVDARMPAYFVDEVAQNRDGAEPLSAFLDLFHHRIATQFYRIWRKYRYPTGFRPDGFDTVSRGVLSLVGLGFRSPDTRAPDRGFPPGVGARTLLSMLGLAAQKTRTAQGLAGVLGAAVPDAAIAVEEFYPVWRTVNDFEPAALGEQCLLGRGFYDRANTLRIVITPHTRDAVAALVPGQPACRQIIALLRFYLGYESEALLEMRVHPDLMPEPLLASGQAKLGLTTQLGSPPRVRHGRPCATRVQLGRWRGVTEAA